MPTDALLLNAGSLSLQSKPLTESANGSYLARALRLGRGEELLHQTKHGVSFEEAQELFRSDADYLEIFDQAHSDHEDRFIAIGPIVRGIVMVAERDEDVIRIISARPATKREQQMFYRYSGGQP